MTYCSIKNGNPAASDLYIDVINEHKNPYSDLPKTSVADGGYASTDNVKEAKDARFQKYIREYYLSIKVNR